ncbi:MAG: Mur ligase family protein [Elusimicrobiota bacterium]
MKLHFVGVAGTGMSALAQIHALSGAEVTGSDRLGDHGTLGETGRRLQAAGIKLFAQDGSGLGADTSRVVVSTAIEDDNLDLARAAALGLKVAHRADELAALAQSRRTVAVAGTSGKSTVTAMVFQILEAAGRSPSLASGANLPSVRRRGLLGNAWRGESDLLVIEADESDGTLTRYRPALGLLLNISKDHKELRELAALFQTFKSQSERLVVDADAPGLEYFLSDAATYGFVSGTTRGKSLEVAADSSRFTVEGVKFSVPAPGRYNAQNALAAVAACRELGVGLKDCASALASYEGVGRRFERVGAARGVDVIDDFAHNPEKVRAVFSAARLRAKRILAVFQLHGFAPARFLKEEFLDAFADSLGPDDILWLPDIYYVGGTAAKDISAKDYADALVKRGKQARHAPRREEIVAAIAAEAHPGDLVLVMGARDASLSDFAARILKGLQAS